MRSRAKRRQVPLDRYDATLRRVAHALENATRAGALGASGTSERFPPLGLAFKDDAHATDELQFPLSTHATQAFKARAHSTQQLQLWEVQGDALEMRNARWEAFLLERFDEQRDALGVSAAAQVALSLRKMALVGAGASLQVQQTEAHKNDTGVFATLVVALPGPFEGGRVVCRQTEEDASEETFEWEPASRANSYDLSFAVFYDGCVIESAPITSGVAQFLVYDLTTTTPSEIPMFGGPTAIQRSVDAALADYFDPTPVPVAKRVKISADAWRAIGSFMSSRYFAYIVSCNTFDKLAEDEQKIAKSLAAFCANSHGQYVLYLAGVLCSRETDGYEGLGDHSVISEAEDDRYLEVTLKAPWLKHGDSMPSKFPPVRIQPERDVAPLGRAGDLKLYIEVYGMDMDDYDIIEKIHDDYKQTGVGNTFALVVLPVSVEQQQLGKVPIGEVLVRVRILLVKSREEAQQYVRRILRYRSPWSISKEEAKLFSDFISIIVEIDDLELFKDVVRSVVLSNVDRHGCFSPAIAHFGWDACAETIASRILTTPSVHGRTNLIAAVTDASTDATRLAALFDALVSQHPWANTTVTSASRRTKCCESYQNDITNFAEVLMLASTAGRLTQVASATCPVALTDLMIPATRHIKNRLDLASRQSLAQQLTSQLQRAKTVFRNDEFANVRIPAHCSNCVGLQEFLQSNVVETVMNYTGPYSQIQHMKTVLGRQRRFLGSVAFKSAGAGAVRLTKSYESVSSGASERAMATLKELAGTTEAHGGRAFW